MYTYNLDVHVTLHWTYTLNTCTGHKLLCWPFLWSMYYLGSFYGHHFASKCSMYMLSIYIQHICSMYSLNLTYKFSFILFDAYPGVFVCLPCHEASLLQGYGSQLCLQFTFRKYEQCTCNHFIFKIYTEHIYIWCIQSMYIYVGHVYYFTLCCTKCIHWMYILCLTYVGCLYYVTFNHRFKYRIPIRWMAVTTGYSVGPSRLCSRKLAVNSSIDLPCRICYFPMYYQVYIQYLLLILYECSQTRSKSYN